MKINTKKVAVGMPPAVYEAVGKLAKEKKQTIPAYIRWLIWRQIEEKISQFPFFQKESHNKGRPGEIPQAGLRRFIKADYTRPWYIISATSISVPFRIIAAAIIERERMIKPMRF